MEKCDRHPPSFNGSPPLLLWGLLRESASCRGDGGSLSRLGRNVTETAPLRHPSSLEGPFLLGYSEEVKENHFGQQPM